MDNLSTEGVGLLGAEEGGEGDGVYVSVGVVVRFVVAAWEYIAMGSQHAACPQAIAGGDTRERLPQLAERVALQTISAIGALLVATVAVTRRHERVSVLIIIELCGLEREAVGAEQAIGLAHERLLRLVGAEQETLEFDEGVIARNQALAAGYLPLFS